MWPCENRAYGSGAKRKRDGGEPFDDAPWRTYAAEAERDPQSLIANVSTLWSHRVPPVGGEDYGTAAFRLLRRVANDASYVIKFVNESHRSFAHEDDDRLLTVVREQVLRMPGDESREALFAMLVLRARATVRKVGRVILQQPGDVQTLLRTLTFLPLRTHDAIMHHPSTVQYTTVNLPMMMATAHEHLQSDQTTALVLESSCMRLAGTNNGCYGDSARFADVLIPHAVVKTTYHKTSDAYDGDCHCRNIMYNTCPDRLFFTHIVSSNIFFL